MKKEGIFDCRKQNECGKAIHFGNGERQDAVEDLPTSALLSHTVLSFQ